VVEGSRGDELQRACSPVENGKNDEGLLRRAGRQHAAPPSPMAHLTEPLLSKVTKPAAIALGCRVSELGRRRSRCARNGGRHRRTGDVVAYSTARMVAPGSVRVAPPQLRIGHSV
jgi:hypothetical protein